MKLQLCPEQMQKGKFVEHTANFINGSKNGRNEGSNAGPMQAPSAGRMCVTT